MGYPFRYVPVQLWASRYLRYLLSQDQLENSCKMSDIHMFTDVNTGNIRVRDILGANMSKHMCLTYEEVMQVSQSMRERVSVLLEIYHLLIL